MNFRQLRRPEVSINLTPLIDVVFLLLIFFMVSTSFSELTQLVVDLPEAEGAPASTDTTLLLVVDVEGNMTLDGAPVPNDARGLSEALRQRLSGNTDIPVQKKTNSPQHRNRARPGSALADARSTIKMAIQSSQHQATARDPDFNQTVTFCRRSLVKNEPQQTMITS